MPTEEYNLWSQSQYTRPIRINDLLINTSDHIDGVPNISRMVYVITDIYEKDSDIYLRGRNVESSTIDIKLGDSNYFAEQRNVFNRYCRVHTVNGYVDNLIHNTSLHSLCRSSVIHMYLDEVVKDFDPVHHSV